MTVGIRLLITFSIRSEALQSYQQQQERRWQHQNRMNVMLDVIYVSASEIYSRAYCTKCIYIYYVHNIDYKCLYLYVVRTFLYVFKHYLHSLFLRIVNYIFSGLLHVRKVPAMENKPAEPSWFKYNSERTLAGGFFHNPSSSVSFILIHSLFFFALLSFFILLFNTKSVRGLLLCVSLMQWQRNETVSIFLIRYTAYAINVCSPVSIFLQFLFTPSLFEGKHFPNKFDKIVGAWISWPHQM